MSIAENKFMSKQFRERMETLIEDLQDAELALKNARLDSKEAMSWEEECFDRVETLRKEFEKYENN